MYYQGFSKLMGGPIGRFLTSRYNFFARQVTKRAWGARAPLTPEILAEFTGVHQRRDERKGMWVFPQQIVGSSAWLAGLWNQRRILDEMAITLLWGMQDIAFRPDVLDVWTSEFRHAKVEQLDDVGHFPALEATNRLVAAITVATSTNETQP
jgi:haloalkane dehalogenase